VSRAEAGLARARVALDQEQVDLVRARSLGSQGVLAKSELDRAELTANVRAKEVASAEFERDVAAHELEMARAALLQLREDPHAAGSDVEPWEIRSPVPGRVLRVLQESEGVVAPGTPLVELADPSDLEVVVDLLTSDAVQVASGAPVGIDGWGGPRPLAGRVRLVEPAGFTKISALGVEEQRVNVVIDITSPPDEWRSLGDGFRVDARITLEAREDALRVPTSALFRDGDRWGVYAVEDGRARKRIVELGPRGDRQAVVEAGLASGDPVIVFPGDAIADGVRVRAREPAAA
jgi:HlyD family secretion protein